MKRLDWCLVRPPREGVDNLPEIDRRIGELVQRATEKVLDDDEIDELLALEERHESLTVSSCEAAGAPRVEDDADWESRIIDEYAEADTDLDLEDYLELRRLDHDCESCPFASPYSVYPLDPCEFSAGALFDVLADPQVVALATSPMDGRAMLTLAGLLERALSDGVWCPIDALDAADYLRKAVFFLRFWSRYGFEIKPIATDDEAPILTHDHPFSEPDEDSGEPSPVLH